MELKIQKRLAGQILDCSSKRIRFDQERLEDIKEAITKVDIRSLIKDKAIYAAPANITSRFHARKIKEQKKKGRQKGPGSRKGKANARASTKESWMKHIRLQRKFLKELKDKEIIENTIYRKLYRKAGSGFFRSKRHIKLYLEEHEIVRKK